MKRKILVVSVVALALTSLALGALFMGGGDTAAFPRPIGCGADGYCNPFCTFDPDCGPPQCDPNSQCTTDADCQPLGYCASYGLCVCTG